MRSRLKCAIFSNNKKSSNTTGPRGPTVKEFWLSPTGRPASVVILLFSDIVTPSAGRGRRRGLYVQYIVHIESRGIAYSTKKIEFHHLRNSCVIADSGGLSRAARLPHVSQPS